MNRNNVVDFLFEELESFMINENWEYDNESVYKNHTHVYSIDGNIVMEAERE